MKILIADDDNISRLMLERMLTEWGYEVTAVADGSEALRVLQGSDGPKLAILDWVMPGMDGIHVCEALRRQSTAEPAYVLLLTSRDAKTDIVTGLQSGANDYVAKPYNRAELQARVQVGRTVVELQRSLSARVQDLERALAQVSQLQGMLPICSYCKKVRNDQNYWQQVEHYVADHSAARFSHGICPDCMRDVVGPQLRDGGLLAPKGS